MVCAGSSAKITEFLELVNQGRTHREGGKLHLADGDACKAFLENYVEYVRCWYRYALLTIELDHFVELEVLRRKQLSSPTPDGTIARARAICKAQHAYYLSLLGDEVHGFATAFKAGVLDRQNAILDCLNWTKLKTIPDKVINLRLNQ